MQVECAGLPGGGQFSPGSPNAPTISPTCAGVYVLDFGESLRQAVLPAGSDRGLSIGSVYGKPLAGTTPDSKAVQVPCVRMCVF